MSTIESVSTKLHHNAYVTRDMEAVRAFYEDILGFALLRELSPGWIEYRIGANTLALATPSRTAADAPIPSGSAALQLAFKVPVVDVDLVSFSTFSNMLCCTPRGKLPVTAGSFFERAYLIIGSHNSGRQAQA